MDGGERDDALGEVQDWLQGQGPVLRHLPAFLSGLARQLDRAGLQPIRVALVLQLLHPRHQARTLRWQRGKGMLEAQNWPRTIHETDTYKNSPMKAVLGDGQLVRYRLDSADARHPIDSEFREMGAVEYLAVPMPGPSGLPHAFTIATGRPTGFREGEVAVLAGMGRRLAELCDVPLLFETAENVATIWKGGQTWRGPNEKRSEGGAERVHGALVSLELQGVHTAAACEPPHLLLERVNRWYHLATRAAHRFEGEVLRAFAEQVLVFFPTGAGGERRVAQRATALARAARSSLFDLADTSLARPVVPDLVAAIDLEHVVFGTSTVGARMDFTVLGTAIERLRHLARLGRERGEWVVVSKSVAAAMNSRTRPVPSEDSPFGPAFTLVPDPEADTLI